MEEMKYQLNGVNGQLEVYDNKVIIKRKGLLAHSGHGFAGDKIIPINSIQTIQYKPGGSFVNGFIQFGILGGIEARGGISNAIRDENTVIINKKSNTKAMEIKQFIENKILNRYDSNISQNKEKISIADEIMKYKSLLDSGIINQEEFEIKKNELLNM